MFVLICRDTYAVFLRQLQLMAASSLSSLGQREVGRVTGLLGLMEAAIHVAATSPDMLRIEGEEEGGGEESKFAPLLRSLILLCFPPSSQNPFPPSPHLTPHTYTTHIHTPTLINMPHTQTHTHTYTTCTTHTYAHTLHNSYPGNLQLPPPALIWSHATGMLTPLLHCLSSWVDEGGTGAQQVEETLFLLVHNPDIYGLLL